MENYIDRQSETNGGLLLTLFKNPVIAERAYQSLLNRGYDRDDITIMMSEETHKKYFLNQDVEDIDLKTKAVEGVGVGGTIGGTIGAIASAVAAIGTILTIPGLGIIIAGSFAAGLAGAGAGAFVGGLVGGLIGLGISDEQAKEFEAGIKAGGVVIGVETKSAEDYKRLNNELTSYQNYIA